MLPTTSSDVTVSVVASSLGRAVPSAPRLPRRGESRWGGQRQVRPTIETNARGAKTAMTSAMSVLYRYSRTTFAPKSAPRVSPTMLALTTR